MIFDIYCYCITHIHVHICLYLQSILSLSHHAPSLTHTGVCAPACTCHALPATPWKLHFNRERPFTSGEMLKANHFQQFLQAQQGDSMGLRSPVVPLSKDVWKAGVIISQESHPLSHAASCANLLGKQSLFTCSFCCLQSPHILNIEADF